MLVLVPVFPFRADPDDARVLIPADHGPETTQHLKAFIESKYLQRLRESKDSDWHPWTLLSEVPSRRDKKGYALRRPAGQYKKKNWVRKIEYVQGGVGIKKRHLGSNFFFQWREANLPTT